MEHNTWVTVMVVVEVVGVRLADVRLFAAVTVENTCTLQIRPVFVGEYNDKKLI